jgi:hypothetical protein
MALLVDKTKDSYKSKMQEYISRIADQNFIFEVTKCCGYSEILCINKKETLFNFHRNINFQFGKNPEIYVINNKTNEKIILPDSSDILIRTFIIENPNFFTPLYPLPNDVVYRIHFHDGCNHKIDENKCTKENDNEYVDFSHNNMYFT